KAQDELISKERLAALGELAAGIAHEIRNPLTSIKILINSLFSELPEKLKQAQDVNVINEEIERLNRIITQFLEFAKPQELIPEMVHIKNIITDTVTLVAPKIKQQNIALSIKCPQGLPHMHGDPSLLKQAFINLILNALQAMPEGGNLDISASRNGSAKSLDMIRIMLKDTGTGIVKENIKKLFTPFFTTKKEGLGLGLSVTQKIINEHGGKIEIESTVNKGTGVSVFIPVKIKE
ncbi:PAS domain-containing sensor histidine kinase, partial [Candidatus Auribacterota bacterium]